MQFLSDPVTVAKAKSMAKSMDPVTLLHITATPEYAEPIDRTVEIGKPLDPDIRFENDLGNLNRFPLEILLEIVEHLDVASAMDFSMANRMARHVVARSSVTFIKKWAPKLPRDLWLARIPRRFAVWELKEAIRSKHCISCGQLACSIWLVEMVRCCVQCMQHFPANWCLTKAQTTAAFALPLDEIAKIGPIFAIGMREEDVIVNSSRGKDVLGCWVYPIRRTLARAMELYGSREAIKTAAQQIRTGIQDPRFAVVQNSVSVSEFDCDKFRAARLEPLTPAQLYSGEFRHVWALSSIANGNAICAPIVPHAQKQLFIYACRGCVALLRHPSVVHPHLGSFDDETKRWLNIDQSRTANETYFEVCWRPYRMRSIDGMVEHIQTECLGGLSMIYKKRAASGPDATGF
ncbi:uncharacterized protein N7515_006731 [Penicillium bovifimosum]|uniref:F-box domain-containing protein n=1 Tax=Penicillium bovifimosum TaxID=126998 RepID=A0A9W9GV85_9EURO|nr:uncharacterized protein N7515_006731 [Penicillium bovifimosum]KAJ5130692.1 hypothetical protein N7515_006731 [Penicillium bovifimosum]